jgi:hypothetical protein
VCSLRRVALWVRQAVNRLDAPEREILMLRGEVGRMLQPSPMAGDDLRLRVLLVPQNSKHMKGTWVLAQVDRSFKAFHRTPPGSAADVPDRRPWAKMRRSPPRIPPKIGVSPKTSEALGQPTEPSKVLKTTAYSSREEAGVAGSTPSLATIVSSC